MTVLTEQQLDEIMAHADNRGSSYQAVNATLHALVSAVRRERTEHTVQAERVRELEEELAIAQRWILQRAEGHMDHACGKCVPGGEMVDPDFVCVFHAARAAVEAHDQRAQSEEG